MCVNIFVSATVANTYTKELLISHAKIYDLLITIAAIRNYYVGLLDKLSYIFYMVATTITYVQSMVLSTHVSLYSCPSVCNWAFEEQVHEHTVAYEICIEIIHMCTRVASTADNKHQHCQTS